MSTIEELERRLTAAMDRIATGIDARPAPAAAAPDPDLTTALEDERLANAQLQERVRKLSEQLEAAQAQSGDVTARIETLDAELQRLRKVNENLRASNAALRDANAEGVGEPHLINKAMLAELEALRATRASEVTEATAIIDALDALLKQEAMDA